MGTEKNEKIAPDDAYQIVCPYCFNEASRVTNGDAKAFSHTMVHFRAESYYQDETAIEQDSRINMSKIDIEMLDNKNEREAKLSEYKLRERFLLKDDAKYNEFWGKYDGTTEKVRGNNNVQPWKLPVISRGDGVQKLICDAQGFVTGAVDNLGNITHQRVCPFCHNPLPLNFGKNNVKKISIIGVTGAGKTVYISQLLKGMDSAAKKVGLTAFFTTDHETNFIEDNPVKRGVALPDSTSPSRLSQPMFYDIVQGEGVDVRKDTIVLYDIAGENCKSAADMAKFSKFVEHSDGMILLVDPKQLGFIPETETLEEDSIENQVQEEKINPSLALNTLYGVLEDDNVKSRIPIAVCVSKSDRCFDILPDIAREQVPDSGRDETGMRRREFDGKSYNILEGELRELLDRNAAEMCGILINGYINYNFFAVSAVGCECVKDKKTGFYSPVDTPEPRRIEEPILWLFKQFGYIKSNTKVKRPFPIKQPDKEVWQKGFLGIGGKYVRQEGELAIYEEDVIRKGIVQEGR